MINIALAVVLIVVVAGCQTQPHAYQQFYGTQNYSIPATKNALVKPLDLKELPDTIRTEHEDRVNRLARLSRRFGVQAPKVQKDFQIAPGAVPGVNFPTPVIRIRYEERTFFDFNKADIRSESGKILDVMAEQMNRDLPDTSLVILGHTDSVGTDDYNNQLSLRRAAAVMKELANRGVNTEQMSTVSIGESQPIATNATEQGRALNRRVEFMLSRFAEANYVAIEQFPRNSAWLNNHTTERTAVIDAKPKALVVLKPDKAAIETSSMPKMTANALVNKAKNVKPNGVQKTVVLPLQEAERTVYLLPAEEIKTDLLPDS